MSAEQIAKTAKEAFDASQLLPAEERHKALVALKEALTSSKDEILRANAKDIQVYPRFLTCGNLRADERAGRERASRLWFHVIIAFETTGSAFVRR
jgi:hypothetical protein